jgi:hypothetical protein
MHFTSGYNPQADGQAERANQTLEEYLRHYCSYQQDNWADLLPLAEFAYNNAPNASTGISPFFANKGYHPTIDIHPERDAASLRAREFATDLDELHKYLADNLKVAQERYQVASDACRIPPPAINPGNKVFLLSKNIRTTRPTQKLAETHLGPFEVIDHIGNNSIHLRLPHELRLVHPVFHVSQIEPAPPNTFVDRQAPPPEAIEMDGELEYEIREILDSKYDLRHWSSCELFYYVRWLGYEGTDEEYQWTSATNLTHAEDVINNFHERYPTKSGPEHFGPEHDACVTRHQAAAKRRKAARQAA